MNYQKKLQQLLTVLSLEIQKEVSERRGARLLKVKDRQGNFSALKIVDKASKNFDEDYDEVKVIINETEMTRLLMPNNFIASGVFEEFVYLHCVWFSGGSLSDLCDKKFAKEKSVSDQVSELCSLMQKASYPLVKMHDDGYLHGDIQPMHFLKVSDQSSDFSLIDLGLTQAISEPPFPYKGALLHYNAPEVCTELIEVGVSNALSIASEVYSFGAMIYVLATNQSVIPKNALGSYEKGLKAISEGQIASIPTDCFLRNSGLYELTMWCLAKAPGDRPKSVSEVVSNFRDIM